MIVFGDLHFTFHAFYFFNFTFLLFRLTFTLILFVFISIIFSFYKIWTISLPAAMFVMYVAIFYNIRRKRRTALNVITTQSSSA